MPLSALTQIIYLKHGCCSSNGGSSIRPGSGGCDEDRGKVGAGGCGNGDMDCGRLDTASNSFQSYFIPSPPLASDCPSVLARSRTNRLVLEVKDSVRPDRLARLFLIRCSLRDSAWSASSSAVILRLLPKPFGPIYGSLVQASSSCCFINRCFDRCFEMERAMSTMQAARARRAATAAMMIHILVVFMPGVSSIESVAAVVAFGDVSVATLRGVIVNGIVASHRAVERYLLRSMTDYEHGIDRRLSRPNLRNE